MFLLLALIIPYQALLTPIFLLFAQVHRPDQLPSVGLAIVHTVIQLPFSLYIMRNSFAAVPRELEERPGRGRRQLVPGAGPHLPARGGARRS